MRRLKNLVVDLLEVPQLLREVRAGIENQSRAISHTLNEVRIELAAHIAPAAARATTEPIEVLPISDIPFPGLDIIKGDPIEPIVAAPEFGSAVDFFSRNPAVGRSLVSPQTHALLYCLLRLVRPKRVVEIGTFKAATTEAMARAILANGSGSVDTIDPFGPLVVPRIMAAWPPELAKTTQYHPINSMAFFAEVHELQQSADVVFIDGNHDYEFALFDIESAGRFLTPGGFLVIDNIAQPGPFLASRDFLSRHPGWYECGSKGNLGRISAYNSERTKIENTDLCILRAPLTIEVGIRPNSPGQIPFTGTFTGINLQIAERVNGPLYVQCVLRTFGSLPSETIMNATLDITENDSIVHIPLNAPMENAPRLMKTAEPWLVWKGSGVLLLARPPTIY